MVFCYSHVCENCIFADRYCNWNTMRENDIDKHYAEMTKFLNSKNVNEKRSYLVAYCHKVGTCSECIFNLDRCNWNNMDNTERCYDKLVDALTPEAMRMLVETAADITGEADEEEARWIELTSRYSSCSNCKKMSERESNYCHNCGRKMIKSGR